MTEFDGLFEATTWGWRMRGYADATSPVTLWQCAGTPPKFQVNAQHWVASEHMSKGAAEMAAVTQAKAVTVS